MNIKIQLSDDELKEAVLDWLKKRGHDGAWTVHLEATAEYDVLDRFSHNHPKITAEQTKKP